MSPIRAGTAAAVLALLTACREPPDHSAEAATAVRSADSAWAAAFSRRDLDGYLTFVESTASIQQPNGPTVSGTAAIRAMVEGFFSLPNLSGTWQPVTATASRSGELAYTTGTYQLSYTDPSGKPATERGKYLEVWRRQADRSWKMTAESFNSDDPPPGTEGH